MKEKRNPATGLMKPLKSRAQEGTQWDPRRQEWDAQELTKSEERTPKTLKMSLRDSKQPKELEGRREADEGN